MPGRPIAAETHTLAVGTGLIIGAFICLAVVVLVVWALAAYNKLARQRSAVYATWAPIDRALRRRYDLVPSIVEITRGYAVDEHGTLDAVVQARNAAVNVAAEAPPVRADADAALGRSLDRLFAVADQNPCLTADEKFAGLRREVAGTTDTITYARQYFNNAVRAYNGTVLTVPTNIIAAMANFQVAPLFEAVGVDRGPARVRFPHSSQHGS